MARPKQTSKTTSVSARIDTSTMLGLKLLQEVMPGTGTITASIAQLVDKEIKARNLAILCQNGYFTVGDTVIEPGGSRFVIVGILGDTAMLRDEIATKDRYSIHTGGGYAWRLVGEANGK